MSQDAVKLLRELARDQEARANCAPALDDILLFSLERRYLGIGAFRDIVFEQQNELKREGELVDRLRTRVRLVQVEEICFDRTENLHLPNVESVLSSMRDTGHSLLFAVIGEPTRCRVFLGLSQFLDEPSIPLDAAIDGYQAAWAGHFPGARFHRVTDEECRHISQIIGRSANIGVLTGIPSLKREEGSTAFVQGLERLIRSLRGRSYTWMSVADPVSTAQVDDAVESCRALTSDIHHLVRTTLSKGVSSGKTVMMGMFGMMGSGETSGNSFSETNSTSTTKTTTKSDGTSEQYAGGVGGAASGAALGAMVGSVVPGVGTAIGACIGAIGGFVVGGLSQFARKDGFKAKSLAAMFTGDTHSVATSDAITNARAFTNTVSNAVAKQIAGGGFGSFGLSWTRTTTVGQELLNRKAEYCEELLKKYEQRLQEGRALGFWNVGHYFCAEDSETFHVGNGVVRSLFAGMESNHEPPRVIEMPKEFSAIARRFVNLYISFPNNNLRQLFKGEQPPVKSDVVANHPLGFLFNGVGTPLTTKELAIATPLPRQEVEGISVTERAAFGVNCGINDAPSLTVGTVLDRGATTHQMYHLGLSNLPKHVGVFGLTGSGKTNTVFNLLQQLWEVHKIPFLVIEPAKAEYRNLAGLTSLQNDLLVISAGADRSSTVPLRLNPFEFDPGQDTDASRIHTLTHIDRLKSVFNASFPMYASMPYILEEAILDVYRERGWDLGQSRNRFVDIYSEPFDDYVPTLRDLYFKVDEVVRRKGYWVEQQMNIQAALRARLSSLMVGAKGTMFNCKKSTPSSELFDRPVVVELKHLGDDDEKAFLMGLLISRLYEYRESTAAQKRGGKLQHVLVVEEAHRLLKSIPEGAENIETAHVKSKAITTFVDMLSEIRAYGQGVVVVDQVPSRINTNIVKGTAAKIVHRLLAEDDRQMVGKTMGLDEDQVKDLGLLETGQCIVHQDGQRKAFMCGVGLNDTHENRGQTQEVNVATKLFLENNASIINPLLEIATKRTGSTYADVDTEDPEFCFGLHKAMLAAVFSPESEIIVALGSLKPKRYAVRQQEWPQSDRIAWCWMYWGQISDEIWAYYRGEYRDYLGFRQAGWQLLKNWCEAKPLTKPLSVFAASALNYLGLPRSMPDMTPRNPIACAYEQLLVRTEAIASVRDMVKAMSKFSENADTLRLGRSVRQYVLSLLPPQPPYEPPNVLLSGLIEAVAWRITVDPEQRQRICAAALLPAG